MPEDKPPPGSFFQANQAGVEFILVDLEAAFTFAQIAQQSHGTEKAVRNTRNARLGYDTVVRLLTRTALSTDEQLAVDEKLSRLRSALVELGEAFD